MRYGPVILFLFFISMVLIAYSMVKELHQFSENECSMCHVDVEKKPVRLKPMTSLGCVGCHLDSKQKLSHPVDLLPEASVPADMPLVYGKLTCITCHFVHPFSIKFKKQSYFLLRRPGKGPMFCSACHKIDAKGHILFENAHMGSYQVTDISRTLDSYTLQCIECHDDKIDKSLGSLGAGKWQHFSNSKLNHSIGVSYADVYGMKPFEFHPPGLLPSEVRLYNGKIGCGTCHNVYTKEKHMLVVNNRQSRLCLTCHIK